MNRLPTQAELRRAEQLWGQPSPEIRPASDTRRLQLVEFKPVVKNSLRGFATVTFSGLEIADVSVHAKNGRAWASLPSKPQLDAQGQHRRDPNGKPLYSAILKWRSRDLADRFSGAVVELLREAGHQIPGETQ
jgi:hypothetical protein